MSDIEVLPGQTHNGNYYGGKGPLRTEMVELLTKVARQQAARARGAVPAIMAASRVISACEWELEHMTPEQTLGELAGSEERLLEWMRRVMPVLEARVAAKSRPMIEAKVVDDGRSEPGAGPGR